MNGLDHGNKASGAVSGMAAAALLLALGGVFAGVQDVWIDESTQLSGAALPLARMMAWLAGAPDVLGVPADRMPPVSYLVDWVGLHALGLGVFGLRLVHLAVAATGVGLLVAAIGRRLGAGAAAAAGAVLVLSPRLIETSVELRAYPIWLGLVCLQVVLLIRLVERPRLTLPAFALFWAVSLLAIYTHFFGLVADGAMLLALLAGRRDRRTAVLVIAGGVALLVAGIGVVPFVAGSVALSAGGTEHGALSLPGLAYYLLRLAGHSSTLLVPPVAIAFFAGLVALLGIAARAVLRDPQPLPVAAWTALASGVAVTVAAAAVVHGFDPMKPSYSLWTLPVMALLAGIAVAAFPRVAGAAALLFALGAGANTALFIGHRGWFVHGPEGAIADAVGADPAGVAIVYRGCDWVYASLPLDWRYRGRADQWAIDGRGRLHRVLTGAVMAPAPVDLGALRGYRRLVIAEVSLHGYADLRPLLWTSAPPRRGEPAPAGFRQTDAATAPGIYWLALSRFDRENR